MLLSRTLSAGLLAGAIGCTGLFAEELPRPQPRTPDVVPIPLQFAGEEEVPVPAPPPVSLAPPVAPRHVELAPPRKPDPFSQPGFDPFDDEQFRPQTDPNAPPLPTDWVEPPQEKVLKLPVQVPAQDDEQLVSGPRETIRERYLSGAVKVEREMVQDDAGNYVLDGSWRWFTEKGQLIAEGQYVKDKRQGQWRRNFAVTDAQLFRSSPYNQFQPPFQTEATFVDGKLNGAWTIYDGQHRKVSEIFFEDGLRHGPAMWWQPKGTPAIQAMFERGEIHGEAFVFDAAGKVVRRERYEQGWKYARRTEKNPKGKPKEVSSWLDGHYKLNGEDDFWNARIAAFEVDKDPVLHGTQVTYYPNGQMQRQQEFNRGKPVGEVVWWHDNGQRALAGHYTDEGKPDGEWTWWHANGLRSLEGSYLAGKPQTNWTWWNADGKIVRRGELTGTPPETIATSPAPTTLGRPREIE